MPGSKNGCRPNGVNYNMRKNCLISLGILMISSFCAPAQTISPVLKNYHFRHIDYADGLLNNSVLAITQDKAGFMWIGSTKGLQRYDGLRFVKYGNEVVNEFFPEERNQRIWLYTVDKMKELDVLNHSIIDIPHKNYVSNWETYTDWLGRSWKISTGYSGQKDKTGNIISGYLYTVAPGDTSVRPGYFVRNLERHETWLVHNWLGLILLKDDQRKMYAWDHNYEMHPFFQLLRGTIYYPRKLMADQNGNIWFYTWSELFVRYNTATGKLKTWNITSLIKEQGKPDKPNGWINSMLVDDHGIVWVATANAGLLRYNQETDNFSYIINQQNNSGSLQYNYEIYSLFQDREENIWVGTDRGITIFNPYRNYFTVIKNEEGNPNSIPKSEITSFIESPKGDLLAATWGQGITVFDSVLQFKKRIYFPGKYEENLVWCLLKQGDGSIWAGCQGGIIHIIDPLNFTVHSIRPPELGGSTIRYMLNDSIGNTWIGLHNGKMAKWSWTDHSFKLYSKPGTPPLYHVSMIHIDREGKCWVGTGDGLKEFDQVKGEYKGYFVPAASAITSGLRPAGSGMEDYDDSTLLVGMENRGIFLFNKRSKSFTPLIESTEDNFSSVHAIKKDRLGDLWFTTDYGIYKIDHASHKLVSRNPEKGVINSTFVAPEFFVSSKGEWFTWTDTEIIGFYPDQINGEREYNPLVSIAGFKVSGQPVLIDSLIYYNKPIKLSYKQNFIDIEYVALDYSGLQQPVYYYQLEGVDKNWVYAGSKAFASYTDLSPGNYTFRVKSENGIAAPQIATLGINIASPFWKTAWFLIIVGVAAVLLAGLLIRARIRTIRNAAQLKQKMAESEMMALRAQMNPHFIFNCINSIDGLIQSNDKYHATVYLNKFAKLIRNVLDSSKQNTIALNRDLETLQLYIDLEKFRTENRFNARINVEKELLEDDYRVPPLIIQPYVENAILHGLRSLPDDRGMLKIDVLKQENQLVYIIEDNGIGRDSQKKKSYQENGSYGMEMTQERVKLYNGEENASVEITDLFNDGVPAGTKVRVALRIK